MQINQRDLINLAPAHIKPGDKTGYKLSQLSPAEREGGRGPSCPPTFHLNQLQNWFLLVPSPHLNCLHMSVTPHTSIKGERLCRANLGFRNLYLFFRHFFGPDWNFTSSAMMFFTLVPGPQLMNTPDFGDQVTPPLVLSWCWPLRLGMALLDCHETCGTY